MRRLLSLACVSILAACGPTSPADDDVDDDVGDGDASGEIDAPSNPTDGPVVEQDSSCGAQNTPIAVENLGDPPDLLIVLDRSGSMSSPIPMFPPNFTSKWMIMRDALNALAAEFQDNIRFGLTEFPTNDDCAVDGAAALRVPIDLDQAPEIMSYFATRSPNGNTPAQLGLQAALAHYNSITPNPAGRFVLFATDGEPNCSAGDPAAETVAAVQALRSAGINTYVLGFGGGFVDDSVLNNSAQAGGVPRPGGPPHYYRANSAAELNAVLDQIAGGIVVPSCSYALASLPPNPDDVTVTLDGMVVPRSTQHTNGWDYYPDSMTITFFGTYCADIEGGAMSSVEFFFGCPGPVID
jgi:hypothetical protein